MSLGNIADVFLLGHERDIESRRIVVRLKSIILAVLFVMYPTTVNAGLDNTKITLFAVVREANPGAGDWTKYGEQDSLPRLTEINDPEDGVWSWEITEQPTGFTGNPAISVNPLGGDNKSAELRWSGFVASDWHEGKTETKKLNAIDEINMVPSRPNR